MSTWLMTMTVPGPDGWALAGAVLTVLGLVAGFELGVAFLSRASREPEDYRHD